MNRDEAAGFRSGEIGVEHSGWTTYPVEPLTFDRLTGHKTADVVVVGAGLVGSSVALHLAECGVRVALVEAREPGWGASGRNAGHVVTHREILPQLAKLPDRGAAFLDLWRRELNLTFELARRHNIDCDAVQGGYLKVAATPRHVEAAHRHVATYAALGLPLRFADRAEVARFTGSETFHAGALDEAGGRINPFAFTRGLARAARDAGASVYANSPVRTISRLGSRWSLTTERGEIEAGQVVLCTGAYGEIQGAPEVQTAFCPLIAYAIATEPLPPEIARRILPGGGICAQLPHGLNPFLIDGLDRLVSASLPGPRAEDFRTVAAQLRAWMGRRFDFIDPSKIAIEAYWTGRIAYSTDQLPRIWDLGPGLLALNCFSSEGNVPGPMLGKHLAEAIVQGDFSRMALPVQPAEAIRWRGRYDFILRRVLVPAQTVLSRAGLIL